MPSSFVIILPSRYKKMIEQKNSIQTTKSPI